jgi:CheY-like chemotaxis protein
MKKITVLLVEDHTIVREGVHKLLELEDDLEVVGEAQDGRQAVALVKKLRPAVVVMDIAMPLLNGLEGIRQILRAVPSTRILILSAHSDEAYVKNATESGAVGFLLKQASVHVLAEIGMVGLGVMGRNLVLNMADHGFRWPVTTRIRPRWPRRCAKKRRDGQGQLAARRTSKISSLAPQAARHHDAGARRRPGGFGHQGFAYRTWTRAISSLTPATPTSKTPTCAPAT